MSLLAKFKDQFVDHDEEELEEEELAGEPAPMNPAAPVPPRPAAVRNVGKSALPRQAAKPYTMVVVSPKSYSDAEKIGDHLKAMRPVVMNMEKTDADEAQRIVDFVQGIMFALEGQINQISESIYLCAPNNMSVSRENFAAFSAEPSVAPAGAAPAPAATPQWNAQAPQGPQIPGM
jgi:cell division inhibitor SepF